MVKQNRDWNKIFKGCHQITHMIKCWISLIYLENLSCLTKSLTPFSEITKSANRPATLSHQNMYFSLIRICRSSNTFLFHLGITFQNPSSSCCVGIKQYAWYTTHNTGSRVSNSLRVWLVLKLHTLEHTPLPTKPNRYSY